MKLEVDIPDGVLVAEKMAPPEFACHLKTVAAMKLHEMGRFSSGLAAELAGMSRVEFLSRAAEYRVFPFASELEDLEHRAPT